MALCVEFKNMVWVLVSRHGFSVEYHEANREGKGI